MRMARVYATTADYAASPYGDPDVAVTAAALARASLTLDTALIGIYYNHDDNGMPTEQANIDLFRDMTVAIAHWMVEVGDDGTGAVALYDTAKIGTASYTRSSYNGTTTAIRVGNGVLPPVAADMLRLSGLRVRPHIHG